MRKLISTFVLAAVAVSAAAQDFGDLFDSFAKEANSEYQSFRDDANKAFVSLLKESCVEFQVLQGEEYPKKPKKAPVAHIGAPAGLAMEDYRGVKFNVLATAR